MLRSILIADDDADVLMALSLLLKKHGYAVVTATSPSETLRALERKSYTCILTDLNFSQDTTSGNEGLALISDIRQLDGQVPIIALTGFGSIDLAVEAMQLGANDFIEKPWRNNQLVSRVEQQIQRFEALNKNQKLQQENAILKAAHNSEIIAQSQLMQSLLQQIQRIAVSDMNVLFTGENGTGKSLLANYLHQYSSRKEHTFLAVNMGGINESLFESEMFGHVKGAFTDAKDDRIGRFEIADKGTLFLDEIANISLVQQAKLLRVLEEKQFERVGSSITKEANVRLLSATNGDLPNMVVEGQFRQDLLYRLNTIEIRIPSLRERVEDILPLANNFIKQLCQKYAMPVKTLTDEAVTVMLDYKWPGNIRELAHTMERALFMSQAQQIEPQALALPVTISDNQAQAEPTLEQLEKQVIIKRLQQYNNDPHKTAESLGLSRSAYYRRLEKFHLN